MIWPMTIYDNLDGRLDVSRYPDVLSKTSHIKHVREIEGALWVGVGGQYHSNPPRELSWSALTFDRVVRLADYNGRPPVFQTDRYPWCWQRGSFFLVGGVEYVFLGEQAKFLQPISGVNGSQKYKVGYQPNVEWLFGIRPGAVAWCPRCHASWLSGGDIEAGPDECEWSAQSIVCNDPTPNEGLHYVLYRHGDSAWRRPALDEGLFEPVPPEDTVPIQFALEL